MAKTQKMLVRRGNTPRGVTDAGGSSTGEEKGSEKGERERKTRPRRFFQLGLEFRFCGSAARSTSTKVQATCQHLKTRRPSICSIYTGFGLSTSSRDTSSLWLSDEFLKISGKCESRFNQLDFFWVVLVLNTDINHRINFHGFEITFFLLKS